METHLKTIIFVGRSGSGKGTQAEMLIDVLKKKNPNTPIFYQETGEAFREFINGDSFTQKKSQAIMNEGGLQPPFLAVLMWGNSFVQKLTGEEHLIIDGTPRYLDEANLLDSALSFYCRTAYVVYIDISEAEAISRLEKRGRADDKECKDIKERMRWFEQSVMETIDHYKNSNTHTLINIKGGCSIEDVHKEILEKLDLL